MLIFRKPLAVCRFLVTCNRTKDKCDLDATVLYGIPQDIAQSISLKDNTADVLLKRMSSVRLITDTVAVFSDNLDNNHRLRTV